MSRRKQSAPHQVTDAINERTEDDEETTSVENRNPSEEKGTETNAKPKETPITRSGIPCKICGKILRTNHTLQRHLLTHSEEKRFHCSKCTAGFKTSSNLHRHMKIHDREENPQPVVDIPAQKRSARQNVRPPTKFREFDTEIPGIKAKEEEAPEIMNKVTKAPKMSGDLIDRFGDHNNTEYVDGDMFDENSTESVENILSDLHACPDCDQTFLSKFGLEVHYKAEHRDYIKCEICSEEFMNENLLLKHQEKSHNELLQNQEDSPSQALKELKAKDFTLGSFPNIDDEESSSKEKEDGGFLCSICNKTFVVYDALVRHVENEHEKHQLDGANDKNAEWPMSNELENDLDDSFTKDNEEVADLTNDDRPRLTLKIVRRKSTPVEQPVDMPYFIDSEAHGGSSNGSKEHENTSDILKETDLRSAYENSLMSYDNQQNSRKISRKGHSKDRRGNGHFSKRVAMVCQLCNYSTEEKSALIRHYRTHTGIRPFFCKVCKDSFTNKANCERHIRKRHMEAIGGDIKSVVGCDMELLQRVDLSNKRMLALMPIEKSVISAKNIGSKQQSKQLRPDVHKSFDCLMCSINFGGKAAFMQHMIDQHQDLPREKFIAMIKRQTTKTNVLNGNIPVSPAVSENAEVPPVSKPQPQRPPPVNSFPQASASPPQLVDDAIVISQPKKRKIVEEEITHPEPPAITKKAKFIPLLKIKAYSEAASTFYSKITESYTDMIERGLFMKNSRVFKLDKMHESDDTEQQQTQLQPVFKASLTSKKHTCPVCEVTFDHLDHLKCHMAINHEDADDFPKDTCLPPRPQGAAKRKQYRVLRAQGGQYHGNISSSNVENMQTVNKQGVNSDNIEEPKTFLEKSNSKDSSPTRNENILDLMGQGSWRSNIFQQMNEEDERYDDSPSNPEPITTQISESRPTMVNMRKLPAMSSTSLSVVEPSSGGTPLPDDQVLVPSKGRFYKARKCPQCDKSFPWASSLRRHIMTHTGLKLYMCRICSMRFTTRSNLVRHVYRRHGIAKQHPDFKNCLAKLHPSDTLLQKMEANVRKGNNGEAAEEEELDEAMDETMETNEETEDYSLVINEENESDEDSEKSRNLSRFQQQIECDPHTKLVSLDYSPRGDLIDARKQNNSPNHQNGTENSSPDKKPHDSSPSSKWSLSKILPKNNAFLAGVSKKKERVPLYKRLPELKVRNKQSTQFVCGVCKVIFEDVPALIKHLKVHNVSHPWHCPICAVPFTNKYNCHRHIARRHEMCDVQPIHMNDTKALEAANINNLTQEVPHTTTTDHTNNDHSAQNNDHSAQNNDNMVKNNSLIVENNDDIVTDNEISHEQVNKQPE